MARLSQAIVLAMAGCATDTDPPQFSIAPVPLSPGGAASLARGVNASGEIAGVEIDASGDAVLFVSDGMDTRNAGLPSYSVSITSAQGFRINDNGVVAGVGHYSAPAPGETEGSVQYDRGIVFDATSSSYLAVLEPFNDAGGIAVFGLSLNNANRIVGNASSNPDIASPFPRRAFWFDVDPEQPLTTHRLDPLLNGLPFPTGSMFTVANDVNADGLVAGFALIPDDATVPTNRNRAVLWSAGSPDANGNPYAAANRADKRNDAGTSSIARALNDDGLVVGRMTFSETAGDETAFVFRPGDTELTSLGFVDGVRTEALDVGPNDWIVGYAGESEGDPAGTSGGPLTNRAVLWLPDDDSSTGYTAFDLNAIVPMGAVDAGGWTRLLQARSVNGDGTIVGYGRYVATPGGAEVTRGFVLTVVP